MRCEINKVCIDANDTTTKEICHILKKCKRILFVVDERDTNDYFLEEQHFRKCKYDYILANGMPEKTFLHPSKFIFLVWQGYLNINMFEKVILRLGEIKQDFIYAFKIFYLKSDIFTMIKPQVIVYLQTFDDNSCNYFQSVFYSLSSLYKNGQNLVNEQLSCKLRCIATLPHLNHEILDYVKIKRFLKSKIHLSSNYVELYKQVCLLEKKGFSEALLFLQEFTNMDRIGFLESTSEDINEATKIHIIDEKRSILKNLLKTGQVVTSNDDIEVDGIYSITKAEPEFIRNISTLSTFVMMDKSITFDPKCSYCIKNKTYDLNDSVFEETDLKRKQNNDEEINLVDINIYLNKEDDSGIPIEESSDGVYCCSLHYFLGMNWKQIVFFKEDSSFPLDFKRISTEQNLEKISGFFRYYLKSKKEYITSSKGAVLCWDYSIQYLEHILYLLKKCFEEHYLFLKSLNISKRYECGKDDLYICVMVLPKIVNHEFFSEEYKSDEYSMKKDACKDSAFKLIKQLHLKGFLDDNLSPVKKKFIDNNAVYYELIEKSYGLRMKSIHLIREEIGKIMDCYGGDTKENFQSLKKEYIIDFNITSAEMPDIVKTLRKQACCMKSYGTEFYVYFFEGSNIGIASGESFTEKITIKSTTIKFIKKKQFTEEELEIIIFYQIIFFAINFKRVLDSKDDLRRYHYFVLPFKNEDIDFDYIKFMYKKFFIGTVNDIREENVLKHYLLYNPVLKSFYEFERESEKGLEDRIDSENEKKVFQKKHKISKSKLSKKKNDSSFVTNIVFFGKKCPQTNENCVNLDLSREHKDDGKEVFEMKETTYLDYFRNIYGSTILNVDNENNMIFEACSYTSKRKQKKVELHLGSIFYVTSVRRDIKDDYRCFVDAFNIFETVSLAFEFKKLHKLFVSLEGISNAFTMSEIDGDDKYYLGYERLEFIGDSVLKFSVSKYLFKEFNLPLSEIVSKKDSLINNDYLFKISQKLMVQEYFSLLKYSENLFQPPYILDFIKSQGLNSKMDRYIKSFSLEKIFTNNNQYHFSLEHSKKKVHNSNVEMGKKVYADIIESLIGVYYTELGFDESWNFIKFIGILEPMDGKFKEVASINDCCYENVRRNESRSYIDDSIRCGDQSNDEIFSFGSDKRNSLIRESEFSSDKDDVKNTQSLFSLKTRSYENPSYRNNEYMSIVYDKILPLNKISIVEEIIGYKFKNIGYLEKAMVHPSYRNNIFGSETFQKLELIGDCFLDIKVSTYLYNTYTDASPYGLHTHRKNLVNNFTFAMILFKTGLVNVAKTGLDSCSIEVNRNKVSKVYSDIFEAIAGAVVLDNDFCLRKTHPFFEKVLVYMKENSYEC